MNFSDDFEDDYSFYGEENEDEDVYGFSEMEISEPDDENNILTIVCNTMDHIVNKIVNNARKEL